MEELLKIVYRNFLNEETTETTPAIRNINEQWSMVDETFKKLEDVLNKNLCTEIYDKITLCIAEIQEATFIVGFAQCAKIMSNGKIDFLNNGEV